MRRSALLLLVFTTACIGGGKASDDDDDGGGDGDGGGWDVDTDTDTDTDTDGGTDGGGTDGGDTDTDTDGGTDGGDTDTDTDGGTEPATGFAPAATEWDVPDFDAGGYGINTTGQGYYAYGSWAVYDLDGDGLPDLVHMADDGSPMKVHGYDGDHEWWVFFNTGDGFSATATEWDVPDIDAGGYGLNTGSQSTYSYGSWTVLDLTGDGRPDLVHMAPSGSPMKVHGYGDDAYWKVYANTGSGFSSSPSTWDVPDLDAGGYGLNTSGQYYYSYGSWGLYDMDADGKPDLVSMAPAGSPLQVYGYADDDHYWRVYKNTGSGFRTSPATWDVPDIDAGGYGINSGSQYYYAYGSWSLLDVTGDERPDLVHMAPAGSPLQVFGYGDDHYWDVYENVGSDFASGAFSFDVPDDDAGGYGFNTTAQYYYRYGSWSVFDMTGDGLVDFVHSAPAGSPLQVFGYGDDAVWEIYTGDGGGFASTSAPWQVPDDDAGGYGLNSVGQNYYSYGSWGVADIDGDADADFVHMAPGGSPMKVFGYTDDAHWKVYRGE